MGKHTNSAQEEYMVSFMEKHPQLAKNFFKGDRIEAEKLWQTFAQELNKIGPPLKDCNGWKKIWSDKKSSIKKKISQNKKEARATGGGPHNQLYISSLEEAIGKICGLYDCVDGIEGCFSYGTQKENSTLPEIDLDINSDCIGVENLESVQPSTSKKSYKRKRPDSVSLEENLKTFIHSETNRNAEQEKSLKDITNSLKTSSEMLKNTESNLRRIYKAVDKVVDRLDAQTKAINTQTVEISKQTTEIQRHNREVEKLLYEKNNLKKQCLEVKMQQLEKYK